MSTHLPLSATGTRSIASCASNAVCAYLRLRYTPEADKANLTSSTRTHGTSSDTVTYRPGDREVRLTIMRILRDRLRPHTPTTWCGYDLDFTGATFDGTLYQAAWGGPGTGSHLP